MPTMPPLRSSFLHGVALELCSNGCTAFRAFRRSQMKSVTCGLGYGNPRNPYPTHQKQNHPYSERAPNTHFVTVTSNLHKIVSCIASCGLSTSRVQRRSVQQALF